MAETEKRLIQQSETKPKGWKRYINDVFSLRDCDRKEVNRFIKRANYFHPTIKFTTEISENQPNHVSRYRGVQRGKIRKKFHLGHQNSLEADRDFPNDALRLVSTLPLDNRPINIRKSRKVTNVYCLSSQLTTRKLKISNKYWWKNGVWYTISPCWKQILQNLRSFLIKRENLFKTYLWEQKI